MTWLGVVFLAGIIYMHSLVGSAMNTTASFHRASAKPFAHIGVQCHSSPKYFKTRPWSLCPSSQRNLYQPRRTLTRAKEEEGQGNKKEHGLDDYVECKVDSVRVSQGASVVYLRILSDHGNDGQTRVLPVHIGEHESSSLLKEINKQRQIRPLTHDVAKDMLNVIGYRVTKVRITDIVANTYYARIHLARVAQEGEEVDVDARPSDAINLAVRFGAPMYVNKHIAEHATLLPTEAFSASASGSRSESYEDIARSVKAALASYEDPIVMYQLQKDLAVQEERFEDARNLQKHIFHEMTNNQLLRLVVAMEAALSDNRYEEAARLRDEFKRVMAAQVSSEKR